jgi:transposase
MEKIDSRKIGMEAQQERRNQIVRLRKMGKPHAEISAIVGVSETTVCNVWKAYERGGSGAIKVRRRGRKDGSGAVLTTEQANEIVKMLIDTTPDQLKFPFALWTRKAVQKLISHHYGIEIPVRTIGDYLKKWNFTPQRPIRRAYEQNPKKVQEWLEEEYPQISSKAKAEGAEIHWGDETGLNTISQYTRGYSPKGKTPVMRIPAKRDGVGYISTITNQGKVRFMGFRGGMNSDLFIKFLKRLVKDASRKVFLILDNLSVHHSTPVKEWVASNSENIELYFLPAYCPELNPDEYLNCDLKSAVNMGKVARNADELEDKAFKHLTMLQSNPGRVKKYFLHPKINYALS